MVFGAWLTAKLMRAKKVPEFDRLIRKRGTPTNEQTPEQQMMILDALCVSRKT